ncbi:MAG: hypothetical protein HY077_02645 [Elusimicrobia bacterium]|nr:hypothetical protein [Elusimicrobiota bacterium]
MTKLESLDDETLLAQLHSLVRNERENTSEIIAHLVEVDRRELAIQRAPSLYHYCVHKLGYSAAEAYFRIRVARAVKDYPKVLESLRLGELHLETVVRLYPHMNAENADELLAVAKGKSKRQVEAIMAELDPQPEVPDFIRVVAVTPGPCPTMEEVAPLFAPPPDPANELLPPQPAAQEIAVRQARFGFTADEELLQLVERAREILRHKFPRGRLEDIFRDALNALLDKRDPDRRLLANLPRRR